MNSMQRLVEAKAVERLAERDPTLYSSDVDLRQPILQRLGWTDLAERAEGRLPLVENLAAALVDEGASDIVLLGMGGSSLAALVMAEVIGGAPGAPKLHVLDSTSPAMTAALLDALDQESTFFLLSSKSGTTIEPLSLYKVFRAWMEERFDHVQAGRHFIAVTDPGSPLEQLRKKQVMRVALSAPPTVGGRFSALTVFGLAPAALIGIDLRALVAHAEWMERACKMPAEVNPAAALAAWMGDAHREGRDKLTLVISKEYRPLGLWIEQLVAESSGKAGVGIVPVLESGIPEGAALGADRAIVVIRGSQDSDYERFAKAVSDTHPVQEFVIQDPPTIGVEFVRWEFAIALTGVLLGVNPFDEPNVAEAKTATTQVLEGAAHPPRAAADIDGTWITLAGALEQATPPSTIPELGASIREALSDGDYAAFLTYLPYDEEHFEPVREAATALSMSTGAAACVEAGPRYLHSTGQIHKGGPNSGVFIILTARSRLDVPIPGSEYSLAGLYRAQAEGDLITLANLDRRVVRLDLPDDAPATLRSVVGELDKGRP